MISELNLAATERFEMLRYYGAPFVKILYLTDLAQKVLSLRIYSYLCTDLIISAEDSSNNHQKLHENVHETRASCAILLVGIRRQKSVKHQFASVTITSVLF